MVNVSMVNVSNETRPWIGGVLVRLSVDPMEDQTMQYPYSKDQFEQAQECGVLWGGFFEWETLEYAE